MRQRYAWAVLAVCGLACTRAVPSQEAPSPHLMLSIKIGHETPAGVRGAILAEPAIATIAGRPFSFRSGGAVKLRTGEGELEIGTRVTGQLERTESGMVQLALTIRIGLVVAQEDDPNTDLVHTETLDIRTILEPGKAKRLKCSATQWCEVLVDDAD